MFSHVIIFVIIGIVLLGALFWYGYLQNNDNRNPSIPPIWAIVIGIAIIVAVCVMFTLHWRYTDYKEELWRSYKEGMSRDPFKVYPPNSDT